MNESNGQAVLSKEYIKDLIEDGLTRKLSLDALLVEINKQSRALRNNDVWYIEQNYVARLVDLWIKEAPKYIDSISSPDCINQTIQIISSLQTIDDCCNFVKDSDYNILINDVRANSKYSTSLQSKSIANFKIECLYSINQKTNFMKCEVSLVKHLVHTLKFSIDPEKLLGAIDKKGHLSSSVFDEKNFKQFLLDLQNYDGNDGQIIILKQLGAQLLGSKKLYLFSDVKNIIQSYLQRAVVTSLFTDGRDVLQVKGQHIVVSKVLPDMEMLPRFTQVEEVRFVYADAIHVDANFECSLWHGKNIVLCCNSLIVDSNKYTWNVSGQDGRDVQNTAGAQGEPGESGGNVLMFAKEMVNGQNLTIISNGGNGGSGCDAKSLTIREFEDKYPPVSKFWNSKKNSRLMQTYRNVLSELSSIDEFHVGNVNIGPVSKALFERLLTEHVTELGDIYFKVTTQSQRKITFSFYNSAFFSPCESFLLLNGQPGNGGALEKGQGKGGTKGLGGEIVIMPNNNLSENINKPGDEGNPGKTARDRSYMDRTIGSGWPHLVPSTDEDSQALEESYMKSKSGKCVYTPHNDRYAQITVSKATAKIQRSFQKKPPVTSNAYSTRKKALSLDSVYDNESEVPYGRFNALTLSLESVSEMIDDIATSIPDEEEVVEETVAMKMCGRTPQFKNNILNFWFNNKLDSTPALDESPKNSSNNGVLFKMAETHPNDIATSIPDVEEVVEETVVMKMYKGTLQIKNKISNYWYNNKLDSTTALDESPKNSSYNNDLLFKMVQTHPKDLNNWIKLIKVSVDFHKLVELRNEAIRLFTNNTFDYDLHAHVECLLNDKLKLVSLEHVEKQYSFPDVPYKNTFDNLQIDDISFVDSAESSFQRESQFFCEDSPQQRNQFKMICENLENKSYLKEAVKTFIVENASHTKSAEVRELLKSKRDFEHSKLHALNEKHHPLKNLLMRHTKLYQSFIESPAEDNKKLIAIDKALGNSTDPLLSIFYKKYCDSVKSEFDWGGLENVDGNIKDELKKSFYDFVEETGPFSKAYRHFLALYFGVHILTYSVHENNTAITLLDSFNPTATKRVHLLHNEGRFSMVHIDDNYIELITNITQSGELLSKVKLHVDSMPNVDCIGFITNKLFMMPDYDGTEKSNEVQIKVDNILAQNNDLDFVKSLFKKDRDGELLSLWLEKLKYEYIGDESILHFIALHLKVEGKIITAMELCLVINFLLNSSVSNKKLMPKLSWIIAAYPQIGWLVEIILMKLELYLRQKLASEVSSKWREYLNKIKYRDWLILLFKQINTINKRSIPITVEVIEDVLSKIEQIPLPLGEWNRDFCEWSYHLKYIYWTYELRKLTDWSESELGSLSYMFSSLEDLNEVDVCKRILNILMNRKNDLSSQENKIAVENALRYLCNSETTINESLIDLLHRNPITSWQQVLNEHVKLGLERSAAELIKLIEGSKNTSEKIMKILPDIVTSFDFINSISTEIEKGVQDKTTLKHWVSSLLKHLPTTKQHKSSFLSSMPNFSIDSIRPSLFALSSIKSPSKKKYLFNFLWDEIKRQLQCENNSKIEGELINYILLATVFVAIKIVCKKNLRCAQKLTILILLMSGKRTLGQVSTGEGKSLIIVSAAIIQAVLCGKSVDIVTSSHVLAVRDAEEYKEIYETFNLAVDHNSYKDIEDRKKVYSNCKIVYGDLASFQRDYLLDRFYSKNVKGNRDIQTGTVIVDEADSMLLDQSGNMLYLSHDMPDFDKLEPVFVLIWTSLNMLANINHQVPSVKKLKEHILFDIFGLLSKDQIRELDASFTEVQVESTWEYLISEKIISESGELLKTNVEELVEPNNIPYCIPWEHVKYAIKKCIGRNKQVEVPNHLKPFVKLHLNDWIESAVIARTMEIDKDYVIDVAGSFCDPNIIIIDRGTGNDLPNSYWEKALHQFVQLIHACRLSLLSLKAVFISNVSYFNLFNTLYGLTGTLGSKEEQEALKDVYKVSFVIIPTAKPKNFIEFTPLICVNYQDWVFKLVKEVLIIIKERSALIICETVHDVQVLNNKFKELLSSDQYEKVFCYQRDYQVLGVANNLGTGYIIIATNLAGRGTDIKLSQELISAGGLHLVFSFFPNNLRTLLQGLGRVARNGVRGTAQMIFINPYPFVSTVVDLKKQRDLNERVRLEEMKTYYKTTILFEENSFSEFTKIYNELKQQINHHKSKDVQSVLLQECLYQWTLWLDRNSVQQDPSTLNVFLQNLSDISNKDINKWHQHVQNPAHLLKIGLYFFKDGDFEKAAFLFDQVLKREPNFSGVARYYRLLTISSEKDLDKKTIVDELLTVKKQFKSLIHTLLINTYTIDFLKVNNNCSIQYESFKEQQENLIKTYYVYQESIDNIIGSNIESKFQFRENLLRDLIKKKVVIKNTISPSLVVEDLIFAKDYDLEPRKLFSFLKREESKGFDVNMFIKEFPLPSRNHFWRELVKNNILIKEEVYLQFDFYKLRQIDPSLEEKVRELAHNVEHKTSKTQVWLYEQDELVKNWDQTLFVKKELKRQIGKLRLKFALNNEVCIENKRATFSGQYDIKFPLSFDSIKPADFMKVGISNNIANNILEELKQMNMITENISQEDERFFSVSVDNIYDINNLTLSRYTAYSDDVRHLFKFHFAYRTALKSLSNQLNDKKHIKMPLPTNPHNLIVCRLIENEIIKSILNQSLAECKLERLLDLYIFAKRKSEKGWKEVLSDMYDILEQDDIVKLLITNKVLVSNGEVRIKVGQKYENVTAYVINTDKEDKIIWNVENVPENISCELKTIKLVLEEQLTRSKRSVQQCITEARGQIAQVDISAFSLVPLKDCLEKQKCSTNELCIFSLNGFDQVLTLLEKKWTCSMRLNVAIASVLGLSQIGAGIALSFTPFFAAGELLMEQGVNDLLYCVNCCIAGYFSWKQYLINKALCALMLVSRFVFKGLSWMSSKLLSTTSKVAESASSSISQGNTLVGPLLNDVAWKVTKTIGIGIVYNNLPRLVEPVCTQMSTFLVDLFDSTITETFMTHCVTISIQQLSSCLEDKDCIYAVKRAVSETIVDYQSKAKKMWNITVGKLIESLEMTIQALPSIKKMNTIEDIDLLAIGLAVKSIIEVIHSWGSGKFSEMRNMIIMFCDDLNKKLLAIINLRQQNQDQNIHHEEINGDTLKKVEEVKTVVKKMVLDFINETVVSSLVSSAGQVILKTFSKMAFKDIALNKLMPPTPVDLNRDNGASLWKQEELNFQLTADEEFIKIDKEIRDSLLGSTHERLRLKYDDFLLQLLQDRRNPKLFEEIVKHDVMVDMRCLMLCSKVIQAVLNKNGIYIPDITIIMKNQNSTTKRLGPNSDGTNLIELISKDDNNETTTVENKVRVHDVLENACRTLSEIYPGFNWDSNKMREEILSCVNSDDNVKGVIHRYYMSETERKLMVGLQAERPILLSKIDKDYEHVHPEGRWTFNHKLDVNLSHEPKKNEDSASTITSCINSGLNAALDKVNNHIHKKIEQTPLKEYYWKSLFRLTLEDFNILDFGIARPTVTSSSKTPLQRQPLHYQLTVPLPVKGTTDLVDFIISLSLKNNQKFIQPHSPHGPHIVYQIEPSREIRYIDVGVKGHILLNRGCNNFKYSVDDCHIAGQLFLATKSNRLLPHQLESQMAFRYCKSKRKIIKAKRRHKRK